ncbi:MAG: molybdopterin-guanine dinucleotide biosynthesis protein B [Rhodobacteraceae bacterium]|nr:molybdopterin-guanine dinucleotide biosynthesis protein B [Paracoccaceae bacterium]
MKIYGITGWKNSGKTTLTERLVAEITGRGFGVSTIKHAHHSVDVDQPGKDSFRHRAAGAGEVILASAYRWAIMHEIKDEQEPTVEELLAKLSPVDLVLIEGYKRNRHAKIEASVKPDRPLIALEDSSIKAVAGGYALPPLDVPILDINDIAGIADFILKEVGLAPLKTSGK